MTHDFATIANSHSPFVKYRSDAQGRQHMHGMTPGAMRLVCVAIWWSRCAVAFSNWRFDRRYRVKKGTTA